jgi:PAS domain S-box-containing protein/putative nucleotidyltransferase with HDIG domain
MTKEKKKTARNTGDDGSALRKDDLHRGEYENLYQALAESSQTGVYVAQRGKFRFVNPYMLNYSGYGEDEWIGRDVTSFLYPDDREPTRRNAIAMLKGERTAPYEYRFVTKNGQTRWIMENIISVQFHGERAVLGNTMDVTEEREAKAKLAEAEQLYRSFTNNTQTGVFVARKGKVRFANPHLLAYTQCERMEDLIGSDLVDFIYPEDRESAAEHARQMLRGERSYPYEYRMVRKDGSIRWILETVAPIDYMGEPAVLGSSIDITELVKMKEHLVEVRALESSLLAAVPHAVIGLENRRIVFANDSVETVFGWNPQELIGRQTRVLYRSDEDYEAIAKHFYPMLERVRTTNGEFRCVKKDGTVIECLMSAARVGEELKNGRIVVVYEDITRRKQSERALRESEEKYAALVEQAMDGIVIVQNGSCLFANKAMAAMSGYEVGKLTGMPFQDLLVEGERDRVCGQYLREATGGNKPALFESCLLCSDGSVKDVEIAFGAVTIEGQRAEMGYIRDITFRKKAQDEIRRTVDRLKKRLEETVNALASITEKRDPYTAGHQQRVAELTSAIAEEMDIGDDRTEGAVVAATLHDIGKIYEPSEILSKPDLLTDIEYLMMKVHPEIGYDILKNIDFPWPVARIVRQHHERMDGSGYPDGLAGNEILLEARIIAVADVVEAMASHRPYRSALGIDSALEEITKYRGKLYDPDVVDACVKLFKEKNFAFSTSSEEELVLKGKHRPGA